MKASIRQTNSRWLRIVEKDFASQHFGLHTAWRSAQNRFNWSRIVNTAKLNHRMFTTEE